MVSLNEVITVFLSVLALIISLFLLGVAVTVLAELRNAKTALADKVKEFGEFTSKASEANNSMGLMLADLGDRVQVIDERVSMLGGTQTTGGVPKWPSSTKTNT